MKTVAKYRCVRRIRKLKRQRMGKHRLVLCPKFLTAFLCIDKDHQLHMRNGVIYKTKDNMEVNGVDPPKVEKMG